MRSTPVVTEPTTLSPIFTGAPALRENFTTVPSSIPVEASPARAFFTLGWLRTLSPTLSEWPRPTTLPFLSAIVMKPGLRVAHDLLAQFLDEGRIALLDGLGKDLPGCRQLRRGGHSRRYAVEVDLHGVGLPRDFLLRLILKPLVHKVIGAREQTRADRKNGGDNQADDLR